MATVKQHIDVQATLNTPNRPQAAFGVGLFLVDDDQLPVDKRYIYVTPDDYTELDASSHFYKYALAYFGQKRQPEKLMLGRLLETDSLPYFYTGPAFDQTLATWQAITAGSINVDNGTLNEDFPGLDASGITDISQLPGIFNTAFDAAATVTGLVASLDLYNRLVLTAGTVSESISVADAASGTSLLVLLDSANGASVASVAAETLQESHEAIKDYGVNFYNVNLRGSHTNAELVAYAQFIETQINLVDFVYSEADAISSGAATDIGYLLKALSLERSMAIYTEKTTEYPDAAANGCVIPAKEGTTSWSWETLKSVTDSGSPNPLSTTVRATLKDKGYVWLENLEDNVILYDGITCGGEEKRILLGRDWYTFSIQTDIFIYQLQEPSTNFDNETMTALENIIKKRSDEAVARTIILDTPAFPVTVSLPDADDIPAEQRAARKFTELNAFEATINSAINDYKIVGVWTN